MNKIIKKDTAVCNYGGHFVKQEFAEEYLLPYEEKCDYLLELEENFKGEWKKFYLNHDEKSCETVGKYLNHSKKHPNLTMRVYADKDKVEVIFFTLRKIYVNEQLVWNYGPQYNGVWDCVDTCRRCRSRNIKI